MIKVVKAHPKPKVDMSLSEVNLTYLSKTIQLCHSLNRKVLLIRCPVHPLFGGLSNESFFREILKSKFENVECLDFTRFPLRTNEYGDFGHLNYKGAQKFSVWFNTLLSNGLLNKPNKQLYIDEQMKVFAKITNVQWGE